MKSSAQPRRGASRPFWKPGMAMERALASRRSFTLLEMCIVLFIMVLLMGAMTPAMESVLAEQAVRNDSRQLAFMVRNAMLKSTEQHRPYVLELTSTNLNLHPTDEAAKDDADSTSAPDEDAATSDQNAVEMTRNLDRSNKLQTPDPKKVDGWVAMPETTWNFQPGELCPASRVRLARGNSWLELSFNALTGNVENETAYFP